MMVERKELVTVEKTYHFCIKIQKDEYFFIAETLNIKDKEEVISIRRGVTFWDCQKRLTTSQKKEVKRMITRMF